MPGRESFGISPAALKGRLKDAPGGAYVFFGPEELLKHFYLEKFVSLIEKEGMADFNLVRLDFSDGATLDDLEREVNTLPAMAPHRMVLCRALSPSALKQEDAQRLADLAAGVAEDTILILYLEHEEFVADQKTVSKKNVACLTGAFTFCGFPLQDARTLTAWADKILARDGITASPAAMRTLIRLCDGKMSSMRGELEKIACWCLAHGRTRAEEAEVLLFARDDRDFAVYNLCDAVLDGAARPAERYYQNLLRQKTDPLLISGALARLFANCLYILEGADDGEVNRITGLKTWQYEQYRRALYGKKKETCAKALSLCMELDRQLKSGVGGGDLLCEKTVLTVTRLMGGAS